ncbi:uncharacterized protein LOC100827104 [Brachypodium distachyon]|uniref:Uncharacterized protein n=1 Tax=Brachypodium distachyon TaxID=15368 RepID=I1IUT5_BRADI|nr:uncharacterized protein LOC100827104 [Brachypodium distachyon]KQJ92455.1 hypothetical protein BRADI_4g43790v3 [Brachypodium distachyon]|eukprot:XP_003577103.1 uncharacterized protein LOC100827104 [Brachypodium distachyon]
MDVGANNLVLHLKRILHSSIGIGCRSACDYPMVLGAGILLLLLHRICPPLLAFLVSYSPLFLLTGLLLGALLSYGEPCAPKAIGEEASENQQTLSLKSKTSVVDCPTKEVEDVIVEKRTDSLGVYVEERALADNAHDIVLSSEPSKYAQSNVVLGSEEHTEEISEKAELQELESSNTERGNSEVHNQYQLGESTSPCWQSADWQDRCYDSESDCTDESSSPDASMTDIIPMLEELHPLIDLGTGHPTLASRYNLNSSSDDDEDDLEDDDDEDELEEEEENGISNDEDEENKDDGTHQDIMGKNSTVDSLMELQRAKNILKFELDQRLMNLQTTDVTHKLKEASCFHVQVPSISTPRGKPFDPSNGSEVIELPQIPDSAPSVLLPRQNLFGLPSDQILDHASKLQETWTPRSYSPATQPRKHGNLHGRCSTDPDGNGLKLGKGEISGEAAHGSHSGCDAEQEGNNGELSGSLETHIGEEINVLSEAISDANMLKVGCEMLEGNVSADFSNGINSFPIMENISRTSEAKDSVHAGSEQPMSCISEVNNSEQHVVRADSMDEVNSLFRCRMEEVLVQAISEPIIGQPLAVQLEDDSSNLALSSDPGLHTIEASSIEELKSQFSQLNEEAPTCDASDSICVDKPIQEKLSEASPEADEHTSELPTEDGSRKLFAGGDEQTADSSELHVIEASSAEEMKTLFKQLEEDAQAKMPLSSENKLAQDTGGSVSDILVLETEPVKEEDVGSVFDQQLKRSA